MLGIHHARTKVPPTKAALQAVEQQQAFQAVEMASVISKNPDAKGKKEKAPKGKRPEDAREYGAKVTAKTVVEGAETEPPLGKRRNNVKHSAAPARYSMAFSTLGALLFATFMLG